MQCKAVVAVRH